MTFNESAEDITLVWVNVMFITKLDSRGTFKIIVCSSMVTSVCITSEYRTIAQSDARFNTKTNLVNVLYIHGKLYYA